MRAIVSLALAALPVNALASGFPVSPGAFADPFALVTPSLVNAITRSIGLTTMHRAYEPATPAGRRGLDLGVEVTLAKLPPEFATEMSAAGASGAENVPFLPVPRVNLHKGMGDRVDAGLTFIFFQGYRILGFEAKFVLAQPEEGPTTALRLHYTTTAFKVTDSVTMELGTKTFAPELLWSRALDFADPYIGVGFAYAIGTMKVTLDLPDPMPDQSSETTGRGTGAYAFTGVAMKIVPLGLKLTLEGAYSMAGASALGLKFGFNF